MTGAMTRRESADGGGRKIDGIAYHSIRGDFRRSTRSVIMIGQPITASIVSA